MSFHRIILLPVLTFVSLTYSLSQTTAIPDSNFEQALIDLGIDSDGIINAQVLTSDIQPVTSIDIAAYGISSISGIEDFASLTNLYASENNISTVDFSQNLNLKIVNLDENHLSSINVASLTNLTTLAITDNQVDTLDLTNNLNMVIIHCSGNDMNELSLPNLVNLSQLYCSLNNIDSLDLSGSPLIDKLYCDNNELTYLNLKHGGSSYMDFFSAVNNPNLSCILVDNPNQAASCCSSEIPTSCVFSTDCILNINQLSSEHVEHYPSPINTTLWIESKTNANFEIYSNRGDLNFTGELNNGIQSFDLSFLSPGIYFLRINSPSGEIENHKLVKK